MGEVSDSLCESIEPMNDNNFRIDDLDSLRDASIDNELLNDYFLNERYEHEQAEREHLTKHAKRYGYIKIPQHKYLERKDKLALSRNREFI